MKNKKKPSGNHKECLKKHGLSHVTWQIMKETPQHLILKHGITGEVKVVEK